jgi:drug/metabolite transporter (DMT)-like permease
VKVLKYLIPYVVIGTFQYHFAKDALAFSSPVTFNVVRYLVSAGVFLALTRKVVVNRDVMLLSVFTVASSLLWAYGLLYVSPSESAVLSYTMPLFSIPLAYLVLSERPTAVEALGVGIGFSGVVLYGLGLDHGVSLLGGVLTVVNAVFWALFSVYYRKLKDYDPLVVNASQFTLGSGYLLAMTPVDPELEVNWAFAEDVAYTSLLGGALLFFLWNLIVKEEKVSRVTVLTFSIPIFATAFDEVTGNPVSFLQVVGILVMLAGIVASRYRDLVGGGKRGRATKV